jgi:FkbM family methyltransferase
MKSIIRKIIRSSPLLSTVARALRHQKLLSRQAVVTPWGFKFNGPAAMVSGDFEPDETKLVNALLERSDVLVNVGANVGFYCAHALAAGKTCVALEPHPENVALLLRNLKINHWKAEVHPVACGSEPDVLELYGGGTAASLVKGWAGLPSQNSLLVPIQRLDDVIGTRFADKRLFFLIDVEGAELSVLKGAVTLLEREPKPNWLVEICIDDHHATDFSKNPNLLETFECFTKRGYLAYAVGTTLKQVTIKEVADIEKGGTNTIGVHNFFFTESPELIIDLNQCLQKT